MFALSRLPVDQEITDEDLPSIFFQVWWNEIARKIEKYINATSILTLTEIPVASVTTPSTGTQVLFIDTADHKLKRKDSSGTVTVIA